MFRKIAFGIFIVMTALSIIFAFREERSVTTTSKEAYKHYLAGVDYYDKFYFRDAVKELEKAIALDSNFAMAYARLARSYASLGYSQKSRDYTQLAFDKKKFVSERDQLLLDIWKAQSDGDQDKMRQLSEEFISKYPKQIDGYDNLALVEFNKQNWEGAVELYQKCLKIDPNYALAYNMLGYLNYYLGRYDDALSYLGKYIELCPDQANPHDSRGEILNALGRYDEAIEEFRAAFNNNPDFDYAVIHRADSYLALGQLSQADYCYQTLLNQATNDSRRNQYLRQRAMVLFWRSNTDSAFALLDQIIAQDTTLLNGAIDACFSKGNLYYHERDLAGLTRNWETAREMVKKVTEKRPKGWENLRPERIALYMDATLADLQGDLDRSAKLFSEYVDSTKLPNEKIGLRTLYADVLRRKGETDLAKSELQKSLTINPNHARSLVLLADVCEQEGDLSSAQGFRQRAMAVWKNADSDYKHFVELQKKMNAPLAKTVRDQSS